MVNTDIIINRALNFDASKVNFSPAPLDKSSSYYLTIRSPHDELDLLQSRATESPSA